MDISWVVADVVEIVVWVLLVVDVVVVVACVDDLLRAHAHGKLMRAQCAGEHEPAQGHQQQHNINDASAQHGI